MNLDTNYWGITQWGCSDDSDPVREYNDVWGNSYYADTSLKRRVVATHEVGHAIALKHSSNEKDIMYPSCCKATKISDNDEAAVNDLY